MKLLNIQNKISYCNISWNGLWLLGESKLCRTVWSHVTLVHTPVSPLMLISSFLAPLAWSTFEASSIPEAEAVLRFCNCMLIKRTEAFTISCSFNPPSTLPHYPFVLPYFYFFCYYTDKSTFSPGLKQILFSTSSYVLLYIFLHALFQQAPMDVLQVWWSFVTPRLYKICPGQKRDAEEACGGTQQPAGSDVACSVVSATRNMFFWGGQVPNNAVQLRQLCFLKLGEFTTLLYVVFACSSHECG